MPQEGAAQPSRTANACENCRRRKVRCNRLQTGDQPCRNCARHGLQCTLGNAGRRGYPESYVQGLLAKIREQEQELSRIKPRPASDGDGQEQQHEDVTLPDTSYSPTSRDGPEDGAPSASQIEDSRAAGPAEAGSSEALAESPATEMATGPAFESRVRSLLRDHTETASHHHLRHHPKSPSADTTLASTGLESHAFEPWRSSRELVDGVGLAPFLTQAESSRLLDLFLSLLGINQHFLDPRAFSDSLSLLYENEAVRTRQMRTMWYTQYLLVMAIGMLIGSSSPNSRDPPGTHFFAEAMRRLPQTHHMGDHGVMAIEVLCLVALYLQWCDRKHDAYLYIGSAVRLALALGCALPYSEQQGLPSQISHRVRVWWTIYMLDRRLSTALGLPMAVDDQQLRADLPRPAAGFESPIPMCINVRIARTTGEIMTSFYGNAAITQMQLVEKIQATLQHLHETARSIPSSFALDFSDPNLVATRTSASLYLMLFQAKILCIRPIILQIVKDKVQRSGDDLPPSPISPVIARLCESCQQAAIKCIRILSSIKKQKTIALFGFFDLDQTFSAAFILIMMAFIKSNDRERPPDGLHAAVRVLQYLSLAGNQAARQRLIDLKQFCYHVWSPEKRSQDWKWLEAVGSSARDDTSPSTSGGVSSDSPVNLATLNSRGSNVPQDTWENWPQDATLPLEGGTAGATAFSFPLGDNFEMELSTEADGIYSSFFDPNLHLTGVDHGDWAEMEKMFFPP